MSDENIAAITAVAIDAARLAGEIIAAGVAKPLDIDYKGEEANDPVTDVDKRSEAAIVDVIRAHFAQHRILSEEGSTGGDDPLWRWIVDPLDGTINYAHRLPISCVSIAVEHADNIVVGVVYNPLADELFVAEHGKGATLNGTPIRVSTTGDLRRALLTSAMGPWDAGDRRYDRTRGLAPHVQGLRDLGSAALELCYVATGRIDGMAGATLNAWDVAAGALIVREAGGLLTGPYGNPFGVEEKHVVVSNGLLHGAILSRLHDASAPLPAAAEPHAAASGPTPD